MSVPTIYFPDVPYQLGSYAPVRQWSTRVVEGPSGRRQASIAWTRPKRRWRALLLGVDGTGYSVSPTTFKQMRKFLSLLKGRYRNFYIFDPAPQDYDQEEPEAFVGLFDTSFPMVHALQGRDHHERLCQWNPARHDGAVVQDDLGTGGEMRIASTSVPLPSDGDEISVDVEGAQQRIAAVSATDMNEFSCDSVTGAVPPAEYHLDIEENFG